MNAFGHCWRVSMLALLVTSLSAQEQAAPLPAAPVEDFVTKAAKLMPLKQWQEIKDILVEGIKGMPENWKAVEIQPADGPAKERVLFHAWDGQELLNFITAHIPQATAGVRGPSYSRAYWLLGATEIELGDLQNAEDALDRGLKLEPDQPTLLSEKAFLFQKQKRYQEALDLYKQAASVRPWAAKYDIARALRGQGDCLIELGQLDAAEAILRTSLQFSPGHLGAVNSIGYVRSRRLTPVSGKPPLRARLPWNLESANLITKVDPIYPSLVGSMRIEGIVKYNATILVDGTIGQLAIASGPPPLQAAATEALRQWVFKPALLGADPVVVLTQIEIEVKPPEQNRQ